MSGPPRAVAQARLALRAALADLVGASVRDRKTADPAPAPPLVLVACSGGADSLALAVTVAFVAPRLGLRVGAVTVDHAMQAGSAEVARRAADQCRSLGLDPVEVVRTEVPTGPGHGGPEGAARTARYRALHEAAERLGARAVLLGHTADDQAETVLLGLARGSGARSLAGMRAEAGMLRRPFLDLRRVDTEEICRVAGLDFWQDPTNAGDHPGAPLRSQVRSRVLPLLDDVLGPGVVAALTRTAAQLDEDDAALVTFAALLLDRARAVASGQREVGGQDPSMDPSMAARSGRPARDVLDVAVLADSPAAVRTRALRRAALEVGCPAGSLARSHVLELDRLVTDWRGQGPIQLPGAVEGRRDCGTLVLEHLHN
ncbi:tRNA(Ile)-lysidine synthase [Sanguibacter gelidistatuariae]|uniref:tRNA(Ile)-lysidine synthase n=1 Tax=Sanguibacter gelidistatuariae TaxID=1814289 RepID=A0A1G6HUU1_9MICO|nr:tRNA lysidine(34) synthetase TilS [Sanguibacter gelidistatuariae]SDB97236.1 tRNA(Ile)-lysidine synthase [Sanguibacter gelidistatuariae]